MTTEDIDTDNQVQVNNSIEQIHSEKNKSDIYFWGGI